MNADTTSAVLKNELHRMIVQTENLAVLERVKKIFDLLLKNGETGDWRDELTEQEQTLIQRGLQQLDNGLVENKV